MDFTGERYVPEVHGDIELEHVHRYLQACEIAEGKIVLDIASGEGYGSMMLARRADKVTGVDISIEAIKHARKSYKKENLEFMVGSCIDIPLPDASVDLVVSFETIEHLAEHAKMMQEIKRVLRPNGILLISSPDKYTYSIETGYSNPYHVKELYQHEFKQLLANYFKNTAYFGQRIVYGSSIFSELLPAPILSYLQEDGHIIATPGITRAIYSIALASDSQLPKIASSVFEQPINETQIVQALVAEKEQIIRALVAEKEQSVAVLSAQLNESNQQIASVSAQLNESNQQVASLLAQLDESNEQVGSLLAQLNESNQKIVSISAQLNERENAFQAFNAKLLEIYGSRAWKLIQLMWKVRRSIAPLGSRRDQALQQIIKLMLAPLRKIRGTTQIAPEQTPAEFDRDWYLANNPDVALANIDPYQHYMQHGRFEGRIGSLPKIEFQAGGISFDPTRDTVLVVSHEASRTGAPILSLNIVQLLQKKYNVVSMLLGDGSIAESFRDASTVVVGPMLAARNPALAIFASEKVLKSYKFKFAIVNSIVSYAVLPVLGKFFVPTISLIHEFSVYARPKGVLIFAALWSTELIFSTSVIHENAVFDNPILENHPFLILPQGRCTPPVSESDTVSLVKEGARVLKVLRPEGSPADTIVVLGVGMVQIRKGVDLFIDCAARVMRSDHGKNFRFVWIGTGYNPEVDLNYSIYLADQIHRAGLDEHVFFMEETANIEAAYEAADILLISSRLDPLPNIGIDAMMRGLPLVCFEKTTGIADILIANGLGEECVAPYLDTAKMTAQVLAFAESKTFSQRVGEQMRQIALKEFDIENYVSQIEKIGLASSDRMMQEQMDTSEISASGLARLDFFLPPDLKTMPPDEVIRYYVRSWASGIERRKLFPGFHPGIFLDQYRSHESGGDPLANYLRAGQPAGPWRYDVITSEEKAQPLPTKLRIALHLHVYYPDLLPDMLIRLNKNRVRPDLFISVPTESIRTKVEAMLLKSYSGKVIDFQVVPNRGRDIGPFLTVFGTTFVDRYDVVGHLHTKKTASLKDESLGKAWHTFLMENLLGGSSNMADIILGHLAKDPSIGIIFADDPNAEPYVVGWGRNKSYAETLGPRLRLNNLPENLLFPVGTMFWARVESLLPMFALGLDWQDYPTEPLPYDGSILHALERLLPIVAAKQGFRSVLTNVVGITR